MMETPTEPLLEILTVDARRALRRAVDLRCQLISAQSDAPVDHAMADLSPFGLWLDTPLPLHPGAEVVVSFVPPGWAREIVAFARVTRAVTGRLRRDRGPLGMGLELLDLAADEQQELSETLQGVPPPLRRPAFC